MVTVVVKIYFSGFFNVYYATVRHFGLSTKTGLTFVVVKARYRACNSLLPFYVFVYILNVEVTVTVLYLK